MPLVVSIEESEVFAEKTRELLRKHGQEKNARVVRVPLSQRKDYGLTAESYALDIPFLDRELPGWEPELAFVDGPSTGGSARAIALIDGIRAYGRLRYVLMDDGLRADEIECMRYLARRGLVRFRGVIPVGKGLAIGLRV